MGKDKCIAGVDYPDGLYPEALVIAEGVRQFNVMTLQRGLGIGYTRARRLVNKMIHEGKAEKASGVGRYEFIC